MRRNQGVVLVSQGQQTFGPLSLLPSRNAVEWHGRAVVLTVKEFWVLQALLQRYGRPATRQQLEEDIDGWNESVGSNSVEVHIHYLRKKIDPGLIQTVRGVGYQIGPC